MSTSLVKVEPRLPYPPQAVGLGINEASWRVLTESIWPLAKEPSSVLLALSYCKARNLDPFKKPVNLVPMWNGALQRMVETVWPSIAELRTTAFRTKSYAGCDEVKFGPLKVREFKGTKKGEGGQRTNVEIRVEFPEWAQITVYRKIGKQRVAFVGPAVRWTEAYARASANSELPNDQWVKRPYGQLEKCAEAAALRKAFPEEISDYSAEEMEGQSMGFQPPVSEAPAIELPKPTSKAAAIVASLRSQEPLEARLKPGVVPTIPEEAKIAEGFPEVLAGEPEQVEISEVEKAEPEAPAEPDQMGSKISGFTADEIIEEFCNSRGVDAKKGEAQVKAALWKRYGIEQITDLPLVDLDDVLKWAKTKGARG